ncbi:MAG: DUF1353 domain-containing protein [Fulvimarina manganoxydans]|uniref:DUF1353 domain-containing protein n=1 Tax=Fulvimarina manganoxydans TaxID=937218 RepID=UPI002357E97D|nr:DUF1353 domain-containing protein [Fulvimarina manganoxydans]MCK5931494.1 DUF1353 domain-containing protein [Fulvimarina manganoxydans]
MTAHFEGRIVVEWLTERGADRNMRLVEPFAFIDAAGQRWDVPANAVVNGASIPAVFWSTVGPPFVGDYRRASVVHDHHCEIKTKASAAVHRMFFEACRIGGVPSWRAKIMYAAVKTFGPNWILRPALAASSIEGLEGLSTDGAIATHTEMDGEAFNELLRRIEKDDSSLDDIDAMIRDRATVSPVRPLDPAAVF